jgi:hypothetical protein
MTAVSIAVVPITGGNPGESYRWSVSRDGEEVGSGVAADEDEAYEAAKPLFEMLRLKMASVA